MILSGSQLTVVLVALVVEPDARVFVLADMENADGSDPVDVPVMRRETADKRNEPVAADVEKELSDTETFEPVECRSVAADADADADSGREFEVEVDSAQRWLMGP